MNKEKGSTLLEASLALIPFLGIVLGFIHFCLIYYSIFTLQYTLIKTAREHSVLPPEQGVSKYEQIKISLEQKLNSFHLNTSTLVFYTCNGIVETCDRQDSAVSNSFITLHAKIKPLGSFDVFNVSSTTIIKNEPY